ncbi:MAG TPA: nucleotide pyrophosphatase/phosphodiesterase family protein [Jatrophihabitans sp.]|nr:nucleotide pyrophosphatase/phosphodiesterase family protein [Jatrophihabitans sp.]
MSTDAPSSDPLPELPPAGIVRYGEAALADLLPSALAALGVPGERNPLSLPESSCIVVLLVDGLGWRLLRRYAEYAPFLAGLAGRPLTAGFPTTTATSLASLGTGRPPGEHGLTGYTSLIDELGQPINWLRWQVAPSGGNLLDRLDPEQLQPIPTALERGERAGVTVSVVSSYGFQGSGLTRAVLRGGSYRPVFTTADTATTVAAAARSGRPSLIYCYYSELDLIGHGRGCHSEAWRLQLALIDRAAQLLAERLPDDALLLVTADHGMVDVPDAAKVDYDAEPELSDGVEAIAGEARVRYLHVAPGRLSEVRQRWQDRLAGSFVVLGRDEAIERGWYGPAVGPVARQRIGDLVVLATGPGAVVRRRAEQRLSTMIGQHGALTEDELLVPLLHYSS